MSEEKEKLSNAQGFLFLIVLGFVGLITFGFIFGSWYTIQVGNVGVKVTLGKMETELLRPGLGLKAPFITDIQKMNVQQDTKDMLAECFSSDLQQINVKLKVLYRIPESSAITIMRDYYGEPFEKLALPRIQEALKEVTALKSAQEIVKQREQIKVAALSSSRKKVGEILFIEDIVIEDVALSRELEHAIESKMVQQQEAEKATFKMQQAETDAKTAIIAAKGQAESIRIQGEALEKNPKLVDLKMVEKWNGVAPQVVGAGSNILLELGSKK